MNTDKAAIKEAVEAKLETRLDHLGIKPGSKADLKEQAAFIAGACTVLHAVFGEKGSKTLTDYAPPIWIIGCLTGRSITQGRIKARKVG